MNAQTLHQLIFEHFNHGELITLCYAMGIPEGSLRRETDAVLVTDLIAHCQRRGRLPDLLNYCRQQRPALPWPEVNSLSFPAGDPSAPACLNNLPPENPYFTGRADLLARLRASSGATAITQTICGMGGVGKSQLMLHFAHQQRTQYDIIWWLRVDEALAEDFLALGRALRLPVDGVEQAAAMQMVRAWLNGAEKRWLLLCDNADETEPRELRAWLPSNPQGRVLITSRNPRWQKVGATLRLDVFMEEEAAAFWQARVGAGEQGGEGETLAAELGYLPLALEQAAAYAAANGLGAGEYLALYRARRRDLWERQPAPDDYHATLTTTWEIGFEKARQTPGAADLLNLCCFLAPDNIPLDLLITHADTLPDGLAATLRDPLARNDALNALERYALLTRTDGALSLHRLVQTVARDQMGEERAKVWSEAAVKLVFAGLPDWRQLHEWLEGAQFLPHMTTAADMADAHGLETSETANLCNWIGYYLQYVGQYSEARPFYERALAIREKALGPDHPDTALSLNNLGALLQAMGDLAAARPFYERALAIREKALGPDHQNEALLRSTATSLNNLGALLQAMGDLAGARPFYERALVINEKALGPDHPDTAASLNNLGALLDSMGDLAGARPFYERALAIREKALGPDHPDTARSLNNLGLLLQDMGDLAGARPFYERALAIREKALGPDHPDTARSLNNLGFLLQAMGDLAAARPFYERALVIREKALGPDHPDLAYSLNNLGMLAEAEGDLSQARVYLTRALSIFEKALGAAHPNSNVVRNNLQSLP